MKSLWIALLLGVVSQGLEARGQGSGDKDRDKARRHPHSRHNENEPRPPRRGRDPRDPRAPKPPKHSVDTLTLSEGCNNEGIRSIDIETLPDNQEYVAVYFDNMNAQTTESQGSRRVEANCKLHFEFYLAENERVKIESIEYRGYAYPSRNAAEQVTGKATFTRVYSVGGPEKKKEPTVFEDDTLFTVTDTFNEDFAWPCKKNKNKVAFNARLHMLVARGTDTDSQSEIGLDTVDAMFFKIRYVEADKSGCDKQ